MKSLVAMAMGGLGNQLFIYAANRAFSLRSGRKFFIDSSWGYEDDRYLRSFRLDRFANASGMDTNLPEGVRRFTLPARYRFLRGLNRILPSGLKSYVDEAKIASTAFPADLTNWRPVVVTKGYWQDEQYFDDYSSLIRAELTPPSPQSGSVLALGDRIRNSPRAVFIHVRRINYPEVLDISYYQKAIEIKISDLINPEFFVFGDDPSWAFECLDFKGHPVHIATDRQNDEIADLWLMTQFQQAIIANSTFSWWGAWLSNASTIAPTFSYPPRCAIPQRWTILE